MPRRLLQQVAVLLCMGLALALTGRPQQQPTPSPPEEVDGQLALKCGDGTLVEWYVTEGEFVTRGTPVCETCPRVVEDHNWSTTCSSPASGYLIAEQPIAPGDDLHSSSADGAVAVIQLQEEMLTGAAVRCEPGATFELLLVRSGSAVQPGDPVALVRDAMGELVTCRAPLGGYLVTVGPQLVRGEPLGGAAERRGRPVAWVEPMVGSVSGRAPAKAWPAGALGGGLQASVAPCEVVLNAGGVQAATLSNKEVAVLQACVAEAFAVGSADVVISSISDLQGGVSMTLETTRPSQASTRRPQDVAKLLTVAISRSLEEIRSTMSVTVRSIRLAPRTATYVKPEHRLCSRSSTSGSRRGNSTTQATGSRGGQKLPANVDIHRGSPHLDGGRASSKRPQDSAAGHSLLDSLKLLMWSALLLLLGGSLCLFVGRKDKRSIYRSMATEDEPLEELPSRQHPAEVIEFVDHSGQMQRVLFQYRDHGMVLTKSVPVIVEGFRFNGYAISLGVKRGWKISRVAGQLILPSEGREEIYELLESRLRHLRVWPLRIDFDTGGGATKTFYFDRQPLGIELTQVGSVAIKHFKPDSHAEVRGVEAGWVILRVGNMTVRHETPSSEVTRYLDEGMAHLPLEPGGVKLEFLNLDGAKRIVSLRRQPLGAVFSRTLPVRVEGFEFNSYARERGIEIGWRVLRIADEDLTDRKPEEVARKLQKYTSRLAPWPLRIDFNMNNDAVKTFYFERQPLGIEFTHSAPFKICGFKPDSYAWSRGLEVGWSVIRVGNGLLSHDTKHEVLMRYLDMGLAHLPPELPGGPPARCLPLRFLDMAGKARTLHFQRQPLGIILAEKDPLKVDGFKFNSYAKDLGVRVGWRLTHVKEKDVSDFRCRETLQRLLSQLSSSLAPWPLRLDFLAPEDTVRSFCFDRRPVGLEFMRHGSGLQVSALTPDSLAAAHGVAVGWSLLRAGDVVVPSGGSGGSGGGASTVAELDPVTLLRLLDTELARLPQEPRGLRMEFLDKDGKPHVVYLRRQPLGLQLAECKAGGAQGVGATVAGFDFNSPARDAGIEAGWRVVRVGDKTARVSDKAVGASASWCCLKGLDGLLREESASLPLWPLRMDFQPDDGRLAKVCFFEKKDLGMEFSSGTPLKIGSLDPQGCASAQGLEAGWTVVRVGDVTVDSTMDVAQLLSYIKAGSAHLPS